MPNAYSLRLATAEDYESIQRVYSYVVGPPTGQERTWIKLIASGCMVVAELVTQVVGFGGIDLDAAEQLKWLYVLPEHQGAGIGAEILKHLEEMGWAGGLTTIRLHSAPDAVAFYTRHGYRRLEDRDEVVHDHEGVAMIKDRA